MIIDYEIDCWKCSDWHRGVAASERELRAIETSGDWIHAIRILNRERRRIRVGHRGRLWLIPWLGNRGILIGAGYRLLEILPWITARWEFADHDGGTEDWNSQVLGGPRG
jgi:hypothetical protein